MGSASDTTSTLIGSDRSVGFWRAALSGLTPITVAVVAALVLARTLSVNVRNFIPALQEHWCGALVQEMSANYMMGLLMAAPMLVAIVATANLGPQRGLRRVAALAAAAVVAAGAGALLRIVFKATFSVEYDSDYVRGMLVYVWPRYTVLACMFAVAYEYYRREVTSIRGAQQAEIDRVAFEREMTEARLQVLLAQVEPHFLFNTLANVRRLYEKDRVAGRAMLESLRRYLEVALPRMRDGETTLGRDAGLVDAFLHIQQTRMGRRLAFSIDIPAELHAHPVPPMMLLTLVENAIKHGLNASPQGGLVRVTARCEKQHLILHVADTGVGFKAGSGGGTGLANIRARLAAQFGDNASLGLQNNELGGVTATIVLPSAGTGTAR
jgi:signal transduction histidine kinase